MIEKTQDLPEIVLEPETHKKSVSPIAIVSEVEKGMEIFKKIDFNTLSSRNIAEAWNSEGNSNRDRSRKRFRNFSINLISILLSAVETLPKPESPKEVETVAPEENQDPVDTLG